MTDTAATTITLHNWPPPPMVRIVAALVSVPLLGVGILALYKVILAFAGGDALSGYQWLLGIAIAVLFTLIPLLGLVAALRGPASLRLDAAKGRADLMRRGAFVTFRRAYALTALDSCEVRFHPGDAESSPGYDLIVRLPRGARFEYADGSLPLATQERELKRLCAAINAMIAGDVRCDLGSGRDARHRQAERRASSSSVTP